MWYLCELPYYRATNILCLLVASLLAGFAMLEVGIIQTKNAKSILFKNMLDMFVVALCWFFWGFAIAGDGASGQTERDGVDSGNFG